MYDSSAMGKNLGGRGKKSAVSKKSYRLAIEIGDAVKVISDKYEELVEIDPNQAEKLLSEIEGILLKVQQIKLS